MLDQIIEYLKISFELSPVAQILWFVWVFFSVTAFLSKKDDKTKIILSIWLLVFGMHYFLLGLYTAVVIDLLWVLRNMASIKYNHNKKVMFLFMPLYLLAWILTYSNIYSLLPIASWLLATYSFFQLDGIKMRLVLLICSSLWLTYNFIWHSIWWIVVESFIIIASLLTIFRLELDWIKLKK